MFIEELKNRGIQQKGSEIAGEDHREARDKNTEKRKSQPGGQEARAKEKPQERR